MEVIPSGYYFKSVCLVLCGNQTVGGQEWGQETSEEAPLVVQAREEDGLGLDVSLQVRTGQMMVLFRDTQKAGGGSDLWGEIKIYYLDNQSNNDIQSHGLKTNLSEIYFYHLSLPSFHEVN